MKQYGLLGIENLLIHCIIGIYPHERISEQEIMIDIEIEYDITQKFLDYVEVAKYLEELAVIEKFELIEEFAQKVLENIFQKWQITYAKIKIKKPKALPKAAFAFIELQKGVRQCGHS